MRHLNAFNTVTKRTRTLSGYTTGATMDFTATVTATDASGNTATQDITVQVQRDVGGVDDDASTGTGTGTVTQYRNWNRNKFCHDTAPDNFLIRCCSCLYIFRHMGS